MLFRSALLRVLRRRHRLGATRLLRRLPRPHLLAPRRVRLGLGARPPPVGALHLAAVLVAPHPRLPPPPLPPPRPPVRLRHGPAPPPRPPAAPPTLAHPHPTPQGAEAGAKAALPKNPYADKDKKFADFNLLLQKQ